MCILLRLHYATFDVSRLFCSKGIEEKPLGGSARPPLVKEGLTHLSILHFNFLSTSGFQNPFLFLISTTVVICCFFNIDYE